MTARTAGVPVASEYPKCDSLEEAVQEVKYWCGVNIARYEYDGETLGRLFSACSDFQRACKGRGQQ